MCFSSNPGVSVFVYTTCFVCLLKKKNNFRVSNKNKTTNK